jgi:hypothetical protein
MLNFVGLHPSDRDAGGSRRAVERIGSGATSNRWGPPTGEVG